MENLDDANVFNDSRNEDCTFINSNKTSPLIVCDGVGSSKNARCASQKLTFMLCNLKFSEVTNEVLANLINDFYDEIKCVDASTTCLAIWPQIRDSELKLKVLQLGDCFGYLTLFKHARGELHNLCIAPINQVAVNFPKYHNSDVQCLYETKKIQDVDYCMNVPVQVYKTAAQEKSLYFTPGSKTINHESCTLTAAIKSGLLYHELKFSLRDIDKFEIILGSDGISDNISMAQMFETLSSSAKDKASILFDNAIKSMNSKKDGNFDSVKLVEQILDEIPNDMNNTLVDLFELSMDSSPTEAYNKYPILFKKLGDYLSRYTIYFGNLVCAFRILINDLSESEFDNQKTLKKLCQSIAYYDFILKNITVSKIDDLSVIQATFNR